MWSDGGFGEKHVSPPRHSGRDRPKADESSAPPTPLDTTASTALPLKPSGGGSGGGGGPLGLGTRFHSSASVFSPSSAAFSSANTPFFHARYGSSGFSGLVTGQPGVHHLSPISYRAPSSASSQASPIRPHATSTPSKGNRALEVAMARAAAHRDAAVQKRAEGGSTTLPNVVIEAQEAIGRELEGLRDEVLKTRSEVSPVHKPQDDEPAQVILLAPQGGASTEVRIIPPEEKTDNTAVEALEREVARLKEVELEQTRGAASLREANTRINTQAEHTATVEKDLEVLNQDYTKLRDICASVLDGRLRRTSELHKIAKSQLVHGGWQSQAVMPTAADFARDAEEVMSDVIQSIASPSPSDMLAKLGTCRDRVHEYDNYVYQTLQTSKRLMEERIANISSATSGTEARLEAAERRASRVETDMEQQRMVTDTKSARVRHELEEEMMHLKQGYEGKLASKESEISVVHSQANLEREQLAKKMNDAHDAARKASDDKIRTLEALVKSLRNEAVDVAASYKAKLHSHIQEQQGVLQQRLDEAARERSTLVNDVQHERDSLIENLELAKERAEDKVKALQSELNFQQAQRCSETDLEKHKTLEEINRAKQEAQEAMRVMERQAKKQKQRAEEMLAAAQRQQEQDSQMAAKRMEAQETELFTTKALMEEAQGRCDELQSRLQRGTDEHEMEMEKKSAQLRAAEARLMELAQMQSQTTTKTKTTAAQLIQAEARIQSLSDELSSSRIQKTTTNDALNDARKHSAEVSDQLAHSLKRVLELETRLGQAELEVQAAGARAAMLDGCLAEATTSLTAAEEEVLLLRDSKQQHIQTAAEAVSQARHMQEHNEELKGMLRERELADDTFSSQIFDLQEKAQRDEGEKLVAQRRVSELEAENEKLAGELAEIESVSMQHRSQAESSQTYVERVSTLAATVEERDIQNLGMKQRIEELESKRLSDDGRVKVAELRVEEMKKALLAAKLRIPELERASDASKQTVDVLQLQLKEMRARADARSAEAQTAIERSAMMEGRHKEALARQAVLQKQLAESTTRVSRHDEESRIASRDLEHEASKVAESYQHMESLRVALKEEGMRASRLEGQISEMAAEQVHLQESLRSAHTLKEAANERLLAASSQCGQLESQLTAARDAEKAHVAQLALADGAREAAAASRTHIIQLGKDMEEKATLLEHRLNQSVVEKGEMDGALAVAGTEIAELRSAADRLRDQAAEQYAQFSVELESRETRASEEVARMEGLWTKSITDMQKMRLRLEEDAVAKGTLMGELDAVRSGATAMSMNVMNAEHERDTALQEVSRLSTRLLHVQTEVDAIEERASHAVSSRGELEGMVCQLKTDLSASHESCRAAQESLQEHRTQSASEKATLEAHINSLASGLQDLEYQLQVAATRTNDLEDDVIGSQNDALRAVEVTAGVKTPM